MPFDVEMPDGTVIQDVPEGTTKDQIAAKYQAHIGSSKPNSLVDAARTIPGGLAQGVTGLVGIPGTISDAMSHGLDYLANKVTGQNIDTGKSPLSGQSLSDFVSKPTGGYYQPQTTAGKYVNTIAQFAPAALGPEGLIPKALNTVVPAVASEAMGQATGGTPLETPARIVGAGLGGYGAGALERASSALADLTQGAAKQSAVDLVAPTVKDLKSASGDAYKSAFGDEASNFIVSKDALGKLKTSITDALAEQGYHPDLYPKTSRILSNLDDLTKDNSTLKGIETTRRVANLAAKDFNTGDGFLGSVVRNKIDDFLDNLNESDLVGQGSLSAVQDLKDARGLWKTAQKAQIIDSRINKAENSAANYSQSGQENALRRQFITLANNDKLMAKFTPEEQNAIKAVGQGGPMGNALRFLGKFAARGPVSAGISTSIGHMFGGPVGAAAMLGVGEAAKRGATTATENTANALSALVRGGPDAAQQLAISRRAALASGLKKYAPLYVGATAPTTSGQ